MQASSTQHQSIGGSGSLISISSDYTDGAYSDGALLDQAQTAEAAEPFTFHGRYSDRMVMAASAQTVITYLNHHASWFPRCALPMQVTPLGETGYVLVIGKFGSLGYEVEPKIGLNLLPQNQQGVYRIETLPVPGYVAPGYTVDFQAALQLVELSSEAATALLTQIDWQLDLSVQIHFPRFIQALPKPLVQATGDRLLNQIVRQASRRLTAKVQADFHASHGLALPKQARRSR